MIWLFKEDDFPLVWVPCWSPIFKTLFEIEIKLSNYLYYLKAKKANCIIFICLNNRFVRLVLQREEFISKKPTTSSKKLAIYILINACVYCKQLSELEMIKNLRSRIELFSFPAVFYLFVISDLIVHLYRLVLTCRLIIYLLFRSWIEEATCRTIKVNTLMLTSRENG